MRVNIYAEEMTDRVEIVQKGEFTGVRFYLYLPVTCFPSQNNLDAIQLRGPFEHHPGDDDSAAVTFWGKRDLKSLLRKALDLLEQHEVHE